MNALKVIRVRRIRRKFRVRNKLHGTQARPRLSVFRSNKHIYAQLIDDDRGVTLASASSRDKDIKAAVGYGGNIKAAVAIGKQLSEKASKVGIKQIAFDRSYYRYHGRIKALANAVREAGIQV
jgi:large subunit ribosomal protein L18